MKRILSLFLFSSMCFLLQCGGSGLEEGDEFFAEAKYTQAINSYLEFKKSNPENKEVDSKLTLAYMSKGKQLFDKSRNLDSFAGNYTNAMEYKPEQFATPEQNMQYSTLLFEFAKAYKQSKPANELQEEEYFNNTLKYLAEATDVNSANTDAANLLKEIYQENFQKMFDAGLKSFTDAKKKKDSDLYLRAERFLKKAVQFNAGDPEALKLLNDTRRQTISILEANDPLSFCVPAYKLDKNSCFVKIAMQNFTDATIAIDLKALTLTTTDGAVISPDLKKTADLEEALLEKSNLKTTDLLMGDVIFTLPTANAKLAQISYNHNDEKTIIKYFPQ